MPLQIDRTTIITAARALLQPSEVRAGCLPRWLRKCVNDYCRECDLERGVHDDYERFLVAQRHVCHEAGLSFDPSWLEHWGTTHAGDYRCCEAERESFVSEPYSVGKTTHLSLDALGNALGLDWHFSPNSWWYPGRTLRIMVHQRLPR